MRLGRHGTRRNTDKGKKTRSDLLRRKQRKRKRSDCRGKERDAGKRRTGEGRERTA